MLAALTRARETAPKLQRALTPTDLHRPARRRCGCWPTSTVLFRGIVVGSFGAGRWRCARPAPVERSELPGHRQRSKIPQHRQWWRSPSLAQRCGAAAGKDQRNLAALIMLAALTRAREAAPIPARSDADRPAPAGSAALRLLADVDISFSRNCCWQLRRRTLALGRSAPMLTSASPGRGGGDGAGAGRAQRATGSSATIANSAAPTVVALSLARSALRSSGSERSAEFGRVDHAGCV